jgi:hypothetical protein
MNPIARSTFLRRAGGTIVAGAAFLYPGIDNALAGLRPKGVISPPPGVSVMTLNGPDPAFATGEVATLTPNSIVLHSHLGAKTVRLEPGVVVWKEFETDSSVIEVGDWVDAKVVPQADGTVDAVSGWVFVNIGRHEGTFESTDGKSIVSAGGDGKTHVLELSTRHDVIRGHDLSPVANGVHGLQRGERIGAVGLRLPESGLRITRIWTE